MHELAQPQLKFCAHTLSAHSQLLQLPLEAESCCPRRQLEISCLVLHNFRSQFISNVAKVVGRVENNWQLILRKICHFLFVRLRRVCCHCVGHCDGLRISKNHLLAPCQAAGSCHPLRAAVDCPTSRGTKLQAAMVLATLQFAFHQQNAK